MLRFIEENGLWVKEFNFNNFIAEGAEQRVYIKDEYSVYKRNDAIYYERWVDYLDNLLLNNYFFPETSYGLIGFHQERETLYAVVEQKFVKATAPTDLAHVRVFLESNGFINNRNNDYINHDLGIILEDLHNENVLTQDGVLYFIDTAFYLLPEFYIS